MKQPKDSEIAHTAVEVLKLPAVQVARLVDVNDRTFRRWLEGESDLTGPTRQLLLLLIAQPELAPHLALQLEAN